MEYLTLPAMASVSRLELGGTPDRQEELAGQGGFSQA
jgi:hypothetical protein